jgi:hypothetical protein
LAGIRNLHQNPKPLVGYQAFSLKVHNHVSQKIKLPVVTYIYIPTVLFLIFFIGTKPGTGASLILKKLIAAVILKIKYPSNAG